MVLVGNVMRVPLLSADSITASERESKLKQLSDTWVILNNMDRQRKQDMSY